MSLLNNHITFGLEIECIVGLRGPAVTSDNRKPQPCPEIDPELHLALRGAGVPIPLTTELRDNAKSADYNVWSVVDDCSVATDASVNERSAMRLLNLTKIHSCVDGRLNEIILTGRSGRQYRVDGREIVSRVFQHAELRNGDFARELDSTLWALHREPWAVGHTGDCGLHVHVGLPVQNPVLAPHCLASFRRLAVLAVVCEEAMEGIITRHTQFAMPIGRPMFYDAMRDLEICNYMLDCSTLWDLQQKMLAWPQDPKRQPKQRVSAQFWPYGSGGERYFRLSFHPLEMQTPMFIPGDGAGHGTVEFRIHPGTVGSRRIEMWTRVCVGMVRTCAMMGDTEFRKCLIREGGRSMTCQRFMECFVGDAEAIRYWIEHKREEDMSDWDIGPTDCSSEE